MPSAWAIAWCLPGSPLSSILWASNPIDGVQRRPQHGIQSSHPPRPSTRMRGLHLAGTLAFPGPCPSPCSGHALGKVSPSLGAVEESRPAAPLSPCPLLLLVVTSSRCHRSPAAETCVLSCHPCSSLHTEVGSGLTALSDFHAPFSISSEISVIVSGLF